MQLGVDPAASNSIVREPWDELISRLSYLFADEVCSSFQKVGLNWLLFHYMKKKKIYVHVTGSVYLDLFVLLYSVSYFSFCIKTVKLTFHNFYP